MSRGKKQNAGKEYWGFKTDCYGNIRWVEGDEAPEHQDALRETFQELAQCGQEVVKRDV